MKRTGASRPGARLFSASLHVFDRIALRLSGGRGTLTEALGGLPIVTVATKGARTGRPRSVPLVATPDGEDLIVIASNWGRPRHPSWYYNLKASPKVTVTFCNRTQDYIAREVEGAEREACWSKAVEVYPGDAAYEKRCAPRKIPVIVLAPSAA
ncbi:MAG: nitroreductase family deazaflavin-dependent oxidoreductase [Anaerolineales bacterium]